MNIDGRSIAADILADVKRQLAGRTVVVRAVTARPSAATESYLKVKQARAEDAGMQLEVLRLPETITTNELVDAIRGDDAQALIVQLPLPNEIDTEMVLNAIESSKDADVLSTAAYARFEVGEPEALMPPVAAAVAEILARAEVDPNDKRVVIVGNGRLVGQPVAAWFGRFSQTTVQVVTKESENLVEALKDADIVVTGAGVPGLIEPSHLKQGVVLIDAGTSESGGQVVGDADPACTSVASVFTPVPGGVGPVAVACLFRNVALLLQDELQAS